MAKGDGSYTKWMMTLAKTHVIVLYDWGLITMEPTHARDLLEIMDDRHRQGSTIVTSLLPIKLWYEHIGDPTLGDAILNRLKHNAYKIELKGNQCAKNRLKNPRKLINRM